MPSGKWSRACIFLSFVLSVTRCARPRFDTSTDMGMVLVPEDAEVDSVIFRLRATDQDMDFPLIFEITATVTPVVRIENLPCTLYNKVCQANVMLTKRLSAGRLHDFAIRVRDSKGDSNSMQATISVTNATTRRDRIFPHIPSVIMVEEDAKPGKELDYILVRSNPWSGKPVYIELWQSKELFTIRQRQTSTQTQGVITLVGELNFETQSMYTLTVYATDPYTDPNKDTRNIAGLHLVVIVQDVQDVPPIFTIAPPLTKINNTVQPGDVIVRVHAEDGDKGVPRIVTYGLVSEGNPFTPFFNISESTGEIILARSLEELTQITHVGAPVVLRIVAEENRKSTDEPPAQATIVEVGLLIGEPGNSPPSFENDNFLAWIDENVEPGSSVVLNDSYSTRVTDEDIGKAGVFTLKLENNNGTFEISPTVAERSAHFILIVRENSYIDYEVYKSLRFMITAQEVGPATNLSASVPVVIFLRDVNDNPPQFQEESYEVVVSENITAGSRIIQVHAMDKDTGFFGRIQYTQIIGAGSEAFILNPDTGIITVAMGKSFLDREITPQLQLSVEARDEDGKGLRGTVPLIVNLLDVNDNAPIFEKDNYEFIINIDLSNFTTPAIIKAFDADIEPPNNQVRYEIIHGNYESKFYLNEVTGELFLRKQISKIRITRHNPYQKHAINTFRKNYACKQENWINISCTTEYSSPPENVSTINNLVIINNNKKSQKIIKKKKAKNISNILLYRRKREEKDIIFTLTVRAYDLGLPHMSSTTQISIIENSMAGTRIVMFVVPGENPDPVKTAQTLATITGGKITVQEIRPYKPGSLLNDSQSSLSISNGKKKSIVIARVEQLNVGNSLVDIDKIRMALEAKGVNVLNGMSTDENNSLNPRNGEASLNSNKTMKSMQFEDATVYRAENKLLVWAIIILGLLILFTIIILIVCCTYAGCPFYMAPRKRRIHSSETLAARSEGRPRKHLHRKHFMMMEGGTCSETKQAWSADPRTHWHFNRRNKNNYGIVTLPGDVARIHEHRKNKQLLASKTISLRLHPGESQFPIYLRDVARRYDKDRIYVEDYEIAKAQGITDIDSLQHEFEESSDIVRQSYTQDQPEMHRNVRDQHYFRDENTEIMRLVTREGIEETTATMHSQPEVIISDQSKIRRIDGKDILLQSFIEDQKLSLIGQNFQNSMHDLRRQSTKSNSQEKKDISMQPQQEVLLIPELLERFDYCQHMKEVGSNMERLITDHDVCKKSGRSNVKEYRNILTKATSLIPIAKSTEKSKEQNKHTPNVQSYSTHDLARQNALLTRLFLERGGRAGGIIDTESYLETQSLPGQVAAGTQTDHAAATQTKQPNHSRSDNEKSEEHGKTKRKLKWKKKYGDEPKCSRTLWMRTSIKEEDCDRYGDKQTLNVRRKIKDRKDERKIPIEPEALKEIADSLDEGGDGSVSAREVLDISNSRYDSSQHNDQIDHREYSSIKLTKTDCMQNETSDGIISKKDAKKINVHSKRDNTLKPSFSVLKKEINYPNQNLEKLAGYKIFDSDLKKPNDSRENNHSSADFNKDGVKSEINSDEKQEKEANPIKSENSKVFQDVIQLQDKEQLKVVEASPSKKIKPSTNYRKTLLVSNASSEFKENVNKYKKQQCAKITNSEKVRAKLKRQETIEINKRKKCDFTRRLEIDKKRENIATCIDNAVGSIDESGQSKIEETSKEFKIKDSVVNSSIDEKSKFPGTMLDVDMQNLTSSQTIKSSKIFTDTESIENVSSDRLNVASANISPQMSKKYSRSSDNLQDIIALVSNINDNEKHSEETLSITSIHTAVSVLHKVNGVMHRFNDTHLKSFRNAKSESADAEKSIDIIKDKIDEIDSSVMQTDEKVIEPKQGVAQESIEDEKLDNKKKVTHKVEFVYPQNQEIIKSVEMNSFENLNSQQKYEVSKKISMIYIQPVASPIPFQENESNNISTINLTHAKLPGVFKDHREVNDYNNKMRIDQPLKMNISLKPTQIIEQSIEILIPDIKRKIQSITEPSLSTGIDENSSVNSLVSRETSLSISPRKKHFDDSTNKYNSEKSDELFIAVQLIPEKKNHQLVNKSPSTITFKDDTESENFNKNKIDYTETATYQKNSEKCPHFEFEKHGNSQLTLVTLEDDSVASSESSSKTTFIAQFVLSTPVRTPRHRHLVRMDQSMEEETLSLSLPQYETSNEKKNKIIASSTVHKQDIIEVNEQEKLLVFTNAIKNEIVSSADKTNSLKKMEGNKEIRNKLEILDEKKTNVKNEIISATDKIYLQVKIGRNQDIRTIPVIKERKIIKEKELKKVEYIYKTAPASLQDHDVHSDSIPDHSDFSIVPEVVNAAEMFPISIISTSNSSYSSFSIQHPIEADFRKKFNFAQENRSNPACSKITKTQPSKSLDVSKKELNNSGKSSLQITTKASANIKLSFDKSSVKYNNAEFRDSSKSNKSLEIRKSYNAWQRPWRKSDRGKNSNTKKINLKCSLNKQIKLLTERQISPRARKKKIKNFHNKISKLKLQDAFSHLEDEIKFKDTVQKLRDKRTKGELTKSKQLTEILLKRENEKNSQTNLLQVDEVPKQKCNVVKLIPIEKNKKRGDDTRISIDEKKLIPLPEAFKLLSKQNMTHVQKTFLLLLPKVEDDKCNGSQSPQKLFRRSEEEIVETQPRYMAWYKQNREEMERKKQEQVENEDDNQPPKWLRKSTRQRWLKMSSEDRKIFNLKTPEVTLLTRQKIKPVVNVESKRLKEIVRQGRILRRGGKKDDLIVEIFPSEKPPPPLIRVPTAPLRYHYFTPHLEYKYEQIPPRPFYLHSPPVANPLTQMSPEQFAEFSEEFVDRRCSNANINFSNLGSSSQGGSRLRHQQFLEKKSVFDIAYSEASPSHLHTSSTTPPS